MTPSEARSKYCMTAFPFISLMAPNPGYGALPNNIPQIQQMYQMCQAELCGHWRWYPESNKTKGYCGLSGQQYE